MTKHDLTQKSSPEIERWIARHEERGLTTEPLYIALLEERVRRAQESHKLQFGLSLTHLKRSAIEQRCTTYGALAAASGVEWSKARHQMNGVNGHLDRLLDICFLQNLPLLTAICVNQGNVETGELGQDALKGFITGAKRLGFRINDTIEFHHACREECWAWGRDNMDALG
ncbi:hypothetical protein [Novosphingobium huizhouense]|uniref:hypothetical protein n=1 Tax=Novosphingobium huizhouense TaxID=2866625 RepID=UPI001CD8F862|nr:hypothetical protein [Novosphingobium huizhouense]